MMIVFWIVTSALLANLYREFCDNLDNDQECNEIDERFIATPVLGFFCFVGWVSGLAIANYNTTVLIALWEHMHKQNHNSY